VLWRLGRNNWQVFISVPRLVLAARPSGRPTLSCQPVSARGIVWVRLVARQSASDLFGLVRRLPPSAQSKNNPRLRGQPVLRLQPSTQSNRGSGWCEQMSYLGQYCSGRHCSPREESRQYVCWGILTPASGAASGTDTRQPTFAAGAVRGSLPSPALWLSALHIYLASPVHQLERQHDRWWVVQDRQGARSAVELLLVFATNAYVPRPNSQSRWRLCNRPRRFQYPGISWAMATPSQRSVRRCVGKPSFPPPAGVWSRLLHCELTFCACY